MEKQIVSWRKVLAIAGSFLAFAIGAGFSTGQEVMQYFVCYGSLGSVLAAIMFFIMQSYACASFITAGYREKFDKGSQVFQYYCGKYVGGFFDYFTTLFVFMSFVVMVGGAGAALKQHLGLSIPVGGTLLCVLSALTVILGLKRIVNVISKIGPVIIIVTIFIGVATLIMNLGGLAEGEALIPQLDLLTAGANWFYASLSYVGFGMLWYAGFMSAVGPSSNSQKEAAIGAITGVGLFSITAIVFSFALISHVGGLVGVQIPSLYLATNISPNLASVVIVIIMLGIYSTAVPLLWTTVSRLAKEKTKQFTWLSIGLAAVGCFIGLVVPFSKLINIIYVINGYIGIILFLFMIIKDGKTFRQYLQNKKLSKEVEELCPKKEA